MPRSQSPMTWSRWTSYLLTSPSYFLKRSTEAKSEGMRSSGTKSWDSASGAYSARKLVCRSLGSARRWARRVDRLKGAGGVAGEGGGWRGGWGGGVGGGADGGGERGMMGGGVVHWSRWWCCCLWRYW